MSVTRERYGRESVGTIAIAAIDIQHFTSTVLHKLFVCAVQLLGAVHREVVLVCIIYIAVLLVFIT